MRHTRGHSRASAAWREQHRAATLSALSSMSIVFLCPLALAVLGLLGESHWTVVAAIALTGALTVAVVCTHHVNTLAARGRLVQDERGNDKVLWDIS